MADVMAISTNLEKFSDQKPDILLLMAGTNDMPSKTAEKTAENLGHLLTNLFTTLPDASLILAKIPPRQGYEQKCKEYNNLIPSVVKPWTDKGKKIVIIDMNAALTLSDLSDGVHPSNGGSEKMASVWSDALISILSSGKTTVAAHYSLKEHNL